MADPTVELTRVWLLKAYGDLHTAIQIGGLPDGHLDAGIYHCQQAAEKALKGYLVFREIPFEKIHDLEKIIQQAIPVEPGFQTFTLLAATHHEKQQDSWRSRVCRFRFYRQWHALPSA